MTKEIYLHKIQGSYFTKRRALQNGSDSEAKVFSEEKNKENLKTLKNQWDAQEKLKKS